MSRQVKKTRLDLLLVERGLASSVEKARAMIMAGSVSIDARTVDKPGHNVPMDAEVSVTTEDHPFVGRGGVKLRGALEHFVLDVRGMAVLDVGASTGGFTDCLLQAGQAKFLRWMSATVSWPGNYVKTRASWSSNAPTSVIMTGNI